MKLSTIGVLTLSVSVMAGCSTINYNTSAKTDFFSEPPIGQVVEAYVGDYMLDQGKSTTMEYLILAHLVDGVAYDIPPGSYARIGDYKGIPYFSATNTQGQSIRYAAGLIDPPIALHTKKANEVCVTSVSYQSASCYTGQLRVEDRTVTDNQSFQQTLIYNGSVGKKINISYREFSDGSARNAFTNNVEYDMSKSNVINYKGARIEVLGYDNTSIKFKVLNHFRSDFSVNM
ncbi:hypothetical protein WMQ26_23250 [Vibrio diabolicus]|uniref:hypothetical protein n=1 Tax=Vibrio harveyi group TaxID=717610 RepID=UPI0015F52943|nr:MULTISPECIES: hypothetical protein [Vibrio harveyi group]HAS6213173.1 hypothetical protein [Vibrio vulnificus]EHR6401694.1 hypothetical protein [Vibrio parahaemolyticus]EJM7151514.1 hypothetical protein [Vibrio parahaemolyticus]MDG2622760.1 hypothetical protein [Vibrio parahaemolyticus]MDL2018652.1 hypothetical protein [Vibrio parahaemolyticus]